jgi:hypothetical protein
LGQGIAIRHRFGPDFFIKLFSGDTHGGAVYSS